MSDEDCEYGAELRAAQRFPVTPYGQELYRRKARRDAIAEHFNEKRADQAAARRAQKAVEDEELANYKPRELTAADIRVFDDFNRMDANRNRDIVRDIRTDERRKEQCEALMSRDLDLYYSSGIADKHAALLGITTTKYKGN